MLSEPTYYDFTNVPQQRDLFKGGSFSSGRWLKIEQLYWLNEATRTAEARGSFRPDIYGASYSNFGKDDIGGMIPKYDVFASRAARINTVLDTSYRTVGGTYRILTAFNKSGTIPWSTGGADYWTPYKPTYDDFESNFFQLTQPSPSPKMPSSMIPSQSAINTIADLAKRATSYDIARSNDVIPRWTGQPGFSFFLHGINQRYPVNESSSDEVSASNIWPFMHDIFDTTGYDYRWGSGFYYRCYHSAISSSYQPYSIPAFDKTYYAEADDWYYSMPDVPWRHDNDGSFTEYDESVSMYVIYGLYHTVLWANTSFSDIPEFIFDMNYNARFVFINPWSHITAGNYRGNTSLTIGGNPASMCNFKTIGDAVCNFVNVNSLPHTKPHHVRADEEGWSIVGYQVYVLPVYVAMLGQPSPRDIGD